VPWKGRLYICLPSESNGPNLLDELLKGFIVIPADLPWKWVKRLITSGEMVNHDSWVKMSAECKTGILAVLTVTSGLGDSCIDDDDSCALNILIIYYLMLYIIYVTLIMRLWELYNLVAILVEFDMDSLLLFSPYLRRCFRLVLNQSVGSCRVELIPEVGVIFRCLRLKVISNLICTLYN